MRGSAFLAKKYLSLAPATPPDLWTAPQLLQRARVEYEDELAGGFLKWFPDLDVEGQDVFDIGSGYGGRTIRYCELGAKSAVGLEIEQEAIDEASEFAKSKGINNASFILGFGEDLPFPEASFDIITSYDVFEHVADLERALKECMRVLRPGGKLFAVFPPFYHPTGSHLTWLSNMPWPNVFFRCDTLIKAGNQILTERDSSYSPRAMRPGDRLWTVNGATIDSVSKILRGKGFEEHELKLAPLLSPMNGKWAPWKMKYYAFLVKPFSFIPVVQEAFVHRMVLTLTKPSS